jgi:hypothetical protein
MTIRKVAGLVTALLMILALLPLIAAPAFADGDGSPEACKTGIQATGGDDLRTYTADEGKVVDGVCIKAGSLHTGVLGNGTHGRCYTISGVGTRTVTVERTGEPSPTCQELSHVDVVVRDKTTTTTEESTTTTEQESTTTTEQESTTTTEQESTTTTEQESTTTTEQESTTTTEQESTTTTEQESTTTTETEVEEATTSTTEVEPEVAQETTSTTEAEEETTSTTEDETDETLPFTGAGTDGIALAALVALVSGAGLIFLTRGNGEGEIEV